MNIFIKPREKLTVLKPNGEALNPRGETVEKNSYWIRRIKDNDVVVEEKKGK